MGELEFNTSSDHQERLTLFVDVLLPVPITKLFTYRIPFELNNQIEVGYRVIVQFGRRKIITGIAVKIHETPPEVYEAKYVIDVLDDQPIINEKQLLFFKWIANYYMSTMGEVLNAGMPSGLKLSSESKIQLNPEFDISNSVFEFSEKEQRILDVLDRDGVITYGVAAQILQIKSYLKIIKSLLTKEAILIFEEVKEKYTPKKETYLKLTDLWIGEQDLETLMNQLEKRPKQLDVLLAYLQLAPVFKDKTLNTKGVSKKKLIEKGISASSLKTLEKNKVFESFQVSNIVTSN